jgi:hypothetical protein
MIRDFKMLRSGGRRPGALAAHGGHSVHAEFIMGRTVFAKINLTGEAAVILSRDSVEAVGNHFGPHKAGYADTQWRALYDGGWEYLTRINPTYEVQHIGLGDGSVIQGEWRPFWVREPFRANVPGKPFLRVTDFDLGGFVEEVKRSGCHAACVREWNAMKEPGMSQSKQGVVADVTPPVKGTVRVLVRRGDKDPTEGRSVEDLQAREVVEERVYENVVLNQALTEFARLLAGVDQADRAIDRMQFGAGTTAEVITDTALQVPLTPIKSISSIEYPAFNSVKFTAFLLEDEMNGFPVSEVALLFVSGLAATRKTFPALNKSEDFIFEFQYTLSFPTT